MGFKFSSKKTKLLARLSLITVVLLAIIIGAFLYLKSQDNKTTEPPKLAKAEFSEVKPTEEEKQQYEVAPGLPRALYINNIEVMGAKILPLGLDNTGAIAAPDSIYDVGWYKNSAQPGSGKGAVVLDGHVRGVNDPKGVFYKLKDLKVGEKIVIEKGDGSRISYTVHETEILPVEKVDMHKVMRSQQADIEGLSIITCGGKYDYSRELFEDRVIVYALRDKDQ